MGRFFGQHDGIKRDELCGGADAIPMSIRNIEVASDTTIQRGMLLGSPTTFGVFSQPADSDTSKVFVIAKEDFTANSDLKVTQAFSSGKFNREKIILDESLNIDDFENELRRQNIILTSIYHGTINIDNWQIGN